MKVITAAATGMCFGVRDALAVLAGIDQPGSVAIYGELVHNDVVLHQLEARGFQQVSETDRVELPVGRRAELTVGRIFNPAESKSTEPSRIENPAYGADGLEIPPAVDQSLDRSDHQSVHQLPAADTIVITAHGISDRRRQQLTAAGKTLIDTTCPLVARVHRAAQELTQSGAFIVVIGRADHVEVEGITGDLEEYAVVPSVSAVGPYPATRIGVVCQTTFPSDEAAAIRRQIEICNPQAEVQWVDTICQPTKDRQQALHELLGQVEAVVVVGGRHSHNTLRLVDACRQRGLIAFHVEEARELDSAWFVGIQTVGLTAGTSTLPETVQHVHERLLAISDEDNHR